MYTGARQSAWCARHHAVSCTNWNHTGSGFLRQSAQITNVSSMCGAVLIKWTVRYADDTMQAG